MKWSNFFPIVMALVCCCCVQISDGWSIPYCRECPFDCDDLDLEEGGKHCSDLKNGGSGCCLDLSPEGLAIAKAEDRDEEEEEDDEEEEECPTGFEESENKCTADERRDGCQDIRLNNGTGCVKR